VSGSRKACRALVAVALTGGLVVAMPPPAGSQAVATVTPQVDAVVGSTLTPKDPAAVVESRWQRCPAELRPSCVPIEEAATIRSYTVAAAAFGNRLTQACGDAEACADGDGCAGDEDADDDHAHADDDDAHDDDAHDAADDGDGDACADAELPAPLLRPFPVVRVKGTLLPHGALISLLRVTAPSTATVDVRCAGPRCRLRHRSFGSGRIAALERFLRTRTRITIRVFKPNSVGKYVRLVIRDGIAPKRRDACLMPGSGKPVECPLA
jgi:hypothetical protein